jgi:asparagine synthase (glutamine-hydrolysing)
MSLIYGIVTLKSKPIESDWLITMHEPLKALGFPDHELIQTKNFASGYVGQRQAYFHRQKQIIHQQDDWLIVGDIQLYNVDELCQKLTLTDINIDYGLLVLKAFQHWGEKCVDHFNGDFTFFILNQKTNTFWLCRDHLGVRPMYIVQTPDYVAFASDIRSVLALPFVDCTLDEKKFYINLANIHHIDTTITPFRAIKKLHAAHWLSSHYSTIKIRKYWHPQRTKIRSKDDQLSIHHLRDLIEDAVKIRIPSNQSLASELSGGLDSSVITLITAKHYTHTQSLSAYAWSPDEASQPKVENDERALLDEVVKMAQGKITLQLYHLDPDWLKNPASVDLTIAEWVYQEYSSLKAQGCHYVMTGWGGDQASSYRYTPFSLFAQGEWVDFFKEIKYLAKGSIKRFIKLLYRYTWQSLYEPYNLFNKAPNRGQNFLNETFFSRMKPKVKQDIVYVPINPGKHIESGDIQSRTEFTADYGSRFHLKTLYPLLDKRVIEYATALPRRLFFYRGMSRYAFRKAFKDILPHSIYAITNKDDPARSAFLRATLPTRVNGILIKIKELDNDLFKPFINQENLLFQAEKLSENIDLTLFTKLFYSVKYLVEVQDLLKTSQKNR